MKKYSKAVLIINFLLAYFIILFPFPFASLAKSLLYKPIGYIYVNYVVWPEYRFQKCIWDFSGCKEGQKFSKFSGYSKITENHKIYNSEDFVFKVDYPPYRILDFERLDNLNIELKDMNKKYHYIIVATGDQKDQGTIHGFLLIAFFILTQWLNWRYRFLISEKLYK